MKVLFFAQIRDFTGRAECDLPVSEVVAPDELWSALDRLFPGIAKFRSSTRLARNSNFAGNREIFQADDEVALLPPVSGG
jgi:molybdopterin converting factor small subunit